jgi:hypothetical protein
MMSAFKPLWCNWQDPHPLIKCHITLVIQCLGQGLMLGRVSCRTLADGTNWYALYLSIWFRDVVDNWVVVFSPRFIVQALPHHACPWSGYFVSLRATCYLVWHPQGTRTHSETLRQWVFAFHVSARLLALFASSRIFFPDVDNFFKRILPTEDLCFKCFFLVVEALQVGCWQPRPPHSCCNNGLGQG